ncbi:hypothetical protein DAMNIGENAA_35290 [Desulforhabdus amnigena]|uniref:Transglutaminase-like domain-containing protein n=2 Tax=Desulforhabdus amnigena TaxID=40218 RepID=A0A9W6FWB5_9BACT|nr:hypothetical protein DAMNIGENAA_35290 [Desulforhabdus amnigena]
MGRVFPFALKVILMEILLMDNKKETNPEHLSFLAATAMIDKDHPEIRAYAQRVVQRTEDPVEQAVRLYLAVRDEIRYDPYTPFHRPVHYRASSILKRKRGFCIPKASLLCALSRACHIPCRLGFASVKNHLATPQLLDFLGSDLFVYHAFVEFYLEGKWVKATPAFNRELCELHKVPPLEFNGREDSLFQPYNLENQKYMEYVEVIGSYADVPLQEILSAWESTYGKERVQQWIKMYEEKDSDFYQDFYEESILRYGP